VDSLQSRIDAVTVYRSGALVTRSAPLSIDADGFPESVVLADLPLAMDDTSLRFGVEGEGELPLAVDASVVLAPGSAAPELEPAIDEELEQARLELTRREAAVQQLRTEQKRLEGLSPTGRPEPEEGQPPADSPTEARIALLDFRAAQVRRVVTALAEAEEAARQASEQVRGLKERRRRASSARAAREHELRKSVRVRLEGGGAGANARLVVRYVVPGAQWTPAYALRLDERLGSARVEARALVRQLSGEDWRGVALTLSTASAQAWTELPELRSLRIGRRQPPPSRAWRPPPVGAELLYADHDAVFSRGAPPPQASPVVEAPPEPEPEPEMELAANWALDEEAAAEPPSPPMAVRAGAMAPPPAPMPVAAAASAPARRPSPKKKAKRHRAKEQAKSEVLFQAQAASGRFEAFGSAAAPIGGSFEPEPTVEPERALLDYGGLRMGGPVVPGRGRLSPAPPTVDASVQQARARAFGLDSRPLPGGHQLPWSQGGFDFALRADHPADVRADGVFCSVPLTAGEGPAEPRYLCVPRESQDVFRRVELDSPLDAPLLAGPVDIYVGGGYLLTATLAHTPAKGRVKLGLGVEQALKVARNVHFDEEKAGLIGGSIDLEHTIEVKLTNHLADPARVEVRERIPVPATDDEDAAVSIGAVTPEWEEWEPDERPLKGGRRWRVKVPAGGERTLEARYSVRIPKGHELVGGNRREV
jgi:hypothetical protein